MKGAPIRICVVDGAGKMAEAQQAFEDLMAGRAIRTVPDCGR